MCVGVGVCALSLLFVFTILLCIALISQDHRRGVVQIANFIGHPLSDDAIDRVVKHSSVKEMSLTYHTSKELYQQGAKSKGTDGSESLQKRTGAFGMLRKGRLTCYILESSVHPRS